MTEHIDPATALLLSFLLWTLWGFITAPERRAARRARRTSEREQADQ